MTTKAQDERLVMLIEECGEIIHAASKVLRHGYYSFNPDDAKAVSNRRQLEREIVDLRAVIYLMGQEGDIDDGTTDDLKRASERKLKYAHHQATCNDALQAPTVKQSLTVGSGK